MHVEVEQRHSSRSDRKAPATSDGPPAGARVPGGLDWQAFTAAYFPGRRRHDLEALTAYSAYKRSRDAGAGRSAEPAGIEPGRGATAVRKWEDEGGATLSPDA
jgi:hypothetical protein